MCQAKLIKRQCLGCPQTESCGLSLFYGKPSVFKCVHHSWINIHEFQYFKISIRASIVHFIIVLVNVFYFINLYDYKRQIFSMQSVSWYQFSSPKVVQFFNFSPTFKIFSPIFQVSQANICSESCKRSQICAGSIPEQK